MDSHSLYEDDDADRPSTRENFDVFDDSYEVDDVDMVADGFRPGQDHDRGGERPDPASVSTRSLSAHHAASSSQSEPHAQQSRQTDASRSSTRKSRIRENPFASAEDGDPNEAERPLHRTPSGNFAPLPRLSLSSLSSNLFARTPSQRRAGATAAAADGPSHPYAMYPQGTVARTASVATASTARPPRRSRSRDGGPQHPYALYPQGVADDSDEEHDVVQNPVPMGFLGAGHQFQRRRGPDGEEQDIVGFYGHHEQLPPYTRYPEDGPEKAPLLGLPEPPTVLHSRAPVLGTDPGMPLMHAQLNSTPQSMSDETQLLRQNSRGSGSSETTRVAASSDYSVATKKSWSEKSWRERSKTRFCGVPAWIYLLGLGTLAFIGVVLGAVIGGFVVGQHHAHPNPPPPTTVTTSLYDASLIATPTATSPAVTGAWGLQLGKPQQPQSSCLPMVEQRSAWDCVLAEADGLVIDIDTVTGANTAGASLYYQQQGNEIGPLFYGTQASFMSTVWEAFLLVIDQEAPQDGPAFYFQGWYDKVVVIPEDALPVPPPPSNNPKRDIAAKGTSKGTSSATTTSPTTSTSTMPYISIATPSSKPWFCFWNETFVEGFIYPNEKAETNPWNPTTTAPPVSTEAWYPSSTPAWKSSIEAKPTVTITTTIVLPSTTGSFTGPASAFPTWLHRHFPELNLTEYNLGGGGPGQIVNRPKEKRHRNPVPYNAWTNTQQLSLYPNLVKIEERRIPGSPAPYCVQYQVLDDGSYNTISYPNGDQIVVHLTENDPPYSAYQNAGLAGSKRDVESLATTSDKRTGIVPGACHCQWMSGQGTSG